MGAFLVSFHAKTDDASPVRAVLAEAAERAWLAPPVNGWTSFYEERADMQDSARIAELCGRISAATAGPVIAFLVHDSDFVCYWLYENGEPRDEYNSVPDYFGDTGDTAGPGESAAEALERVRGDADALLPLCPAGTSRDDVEAVLRVPPGTYVFADEHLNRLSELLGIDPRMAVATYRDIGLEVLPEEMGVEFVGRGTRPEPGEDSWGRTFGEGSADGPQAVPFLGPDAAGAGPDVLAALADLANSITDPQEKLNFAIAMKDPQAVRDAVAAGADPNGRNGQPMQMAAATGDEGMVRSLLDLGAKPAGLDMAAAAGRADVVRLLIDRGADVRATNPFGWTPLHAAVQSRQPDIVRLLLAAGADPSAKDAQGQTAADLAAFFVSQSELALDRAAAHSQPAVEQALSGLRTALTGFRAVLEVLREAKAGGPGGDAPPP